MKSFIAVLCLVACAAAGHIREKRGFLSGLHSAGGSDHSEYASSVSYSIPGASYPAPAPAPAARLVTVNKVVNVNKVVSVPQVIHVRKVVSVPQVVTINKLVPAGDGYGNGYGSGYGSGSASGYGSGW